MSDLVQLRSLGPRWIIVEWLGSGEELAGPRWSKCERECESKSQPEFSCKCKCKCKREPTVGA